MRRSSRAHVSARPVASAMLPVGGGQAKRRASGARTGDPCGLRRFPTAPDELQPIALPYAIQDYAASDAEVLPTSMIQALTMLGDHCHYRLHASQAYSSGYAEFCGIDDGFFVHFSDMTPIAPHAMSVSAPNMLRIRIASEGEGEYVPARGDRLDLKGPSASIIIEPPGLPPAEAVFVGHNYMAQVFIHRDALKRLYSSGEQELPAVVQAFIAGNVQHTVARHLSFGPAMLRCLEDLHGCSLEGHSRRLFIRSKAVEMLCLCFEALAQEEGFGSCEATAMTTRGVLKAQRLLMDNFVTPPSLDDLAHDVGLSRSSLCTGFRQIIGQSVFDFIADLRMQHALALLNRRKETITQIAYAVGFNHLSSFSVAVQRRFGATPSELRRRGLPVI